MAIKTVTVKMVKCLCEVCGHEWKAKQAPLRCAKCKTPYWNRKKAIA